MNELLETLAEKLARLRVVRKAVAAMHKRPIAFVHNVVRRADYLNEQESIVMFWGVLHEGTYTKEQHEAVADLVIQCLKDNGIKSGVCSVAYEGVDTSKYHCTVTTTEHE